MMKNASVKKATTYKHYRRIEKMLNVSLILAVLFFILLTGAIVVRNLR